MLRRHQPPADHQPRVWRMEKYLQVHFASPTKQKCLIIRFKVLRLGDSLLLFCILRVLQVFKQTPFTLVDWTKLVFDHVIKNNCRNQTSDLINFNPKICITNCIQNILLKNIKKRLVFPCITLFIKKTKTFHQSRTKSHSFKSQK